MIVYVDASALIPLIKTESQSHAIEPYLRDLLGDGHLLVAGQLIETEMRRAAIRQGISEQAVTSVLENINVFEHESADFVNAGRFPMEHLGSLDALHLAAAQRVGTTVMITFDDRLATAAEGSGIPVLDVTQPRMSM